jgi:hypothetical protein
VGGAGGLGGQPVDAGEGAFDAMYDLALLWEGRQWDAEGAKTPKRNGQLRRAGRDAIGLLLDLVGTEHE